MLSYTEKQEADKTDTDADYADDLMLLAIHMGKPNVCCIA